MQSVHSVWVVLQVLLDAMQLGRAPAPPGGNYARARAPHALRAHSPGVKLQICRGDSCFSASSARTGSRGAKMAKIGQKLGTYPPPLVTDLEPHK